MPTSIKQLKVINNATLAADGTFSIGLRDPLVIRPNAKVGLSKFLCKEELPLTTLIELKTDQTFTLKTDNGFPARSLTVPPRSVVVPKGIYSQQQLMNAMNFQCNKVLVCGDVLGGTTFEDYVRQRIIRPTIDCGLDIIFEPTDDGALSFEFQSNRIQMCLGEIPSESGDSTTLGQIFGMTPQAVGDEPQNISAVPQVLNEWWGYASDNEIIKGAYQSYIQLTSEGKVGCDWYWGLRYKEDALTSNTDPVRAGIHKKADGTWELLDTAFATGFPIVKSIAYTFASGDYFVLFTAQGQLQLQIYAGDPETQDGILNVGALKYNSLTDLPKGFTVYSDLLGAQNVNFRLVINKGTQNTEEEDPIDLPFFRMIWSTDRQGFPQGQSRIITMDFSQAGDLVAQMGLATAILQSPIYQNTTTFTGIATSTVSRVQDIAIYWSLPAMTFVGSADRAKDGRENMVASFTPSRALTTTDNLFYQEEVVFTDIDNRQLMNISTIQFRVINLYQNYNNPLKTTYLSFVLFIQEEYDY